MTAPTAIPAVIPFSFAPVETQSTTKTHNWSWAIYSHAVLDPVDWLSLTVGVRYTQDKKGATFKLVDRTAGTVPDCDAGQCPDGSEVFDAVSFNE